ncbi:MAG: SRPBCC family protein [Acidimicrobiia bacterium]|nr:SRPBCC family protein [Acidimicrobiia bacterium]
MGTVAHYLEVDVPAAQAYAWWRGLTNLPSILPDVESITALSGDATKTHWKVHGPLGKSVEWDAEIVEDVPNQKIAWASVGDDNTVKNAGSVRFDEHGATTGVEVALEYDPPGGVLGEAVAKVFADPQASVEQALASFKQTIEKTA